MKHLIFPLATLIGFVGVTAFVSLRESANLSDGDKVYDLLRRAGVPAVKHETADDSAAIRRGYELVHEGRTQKPTGGRSRKISRFYQCTSCHNVVREDYDLTKVDAKARLDYAIEHDIPYLQASTFWGVVNRETWYNGDYFKKYGDLIDKARTDLVESMQICAQYCAQGRKLEGWETESILAYYWSLQLQLSDLDMSETELEELGNLLEQGKGEDAARLLKSQYLAFSPATFWEAPEDKATGYGHEGDPERGAQLYERSCRNCHHAYGESDVTFDYGKYTFKWLRKHIEDDSRLSIYEIIRHGTYSEKGHKEYMPLYTLEKMSDEQVEHLRAYIEQQAQ